MKAFLGSPAYVKAPWTLHEGSRITYLSSTQAEILKVVGFPQLSEDGQGIESDPVDWQSLWEILDVADVGFKPCTLEILHNVEGQKDEN